MKHVFLLEESIVKNINGYELLTQVEKGEICGKYYSESKIRFMEDHANPTSRTKQDHIILQVGTDDLRTRKNTCESAKSIGIGIGVQFVLAMITKLCYTSI